MKTSMIVGIVAGILVLAIIVLMLARKKKVDALDVTPEIDLAPFDPATSCGMDQPANPNCFDIDLTEGSFMRRWSQITGKPASLESEKSKSVTQRIKEASAYMKKPVVTNQDYYNFTTAVRQMPSA